MDLATHQRPPPPPASVSHGQALPSIASLTSSLSPSDRSPGRLRQPSEPREVRDSGNWSISQSKRKCHGICHMAPICAVPACAPSLTRYLDSSAVSQTMGLQVQTLLNPSEESPSRNSIPDTPSSARYPSGLSQSSQVRHVCHDLCYPLIRRQSNALPSLNQGFDNRLSFEANSHFDSRRSSVDSRMNAGMTHLAISPSSPYDSQNASRVSLVSNLQHQRGITNADTRPNGASPLSPMGRSGPRANHPPRRAPVINPNPRSVSGMPDPMAAAPTKGYAWAFPAEFEPDERRASSSGESSIERSTVPSRQNSFATSVNSSIFTTDSKLPSGQQRLDDGMHPYFCYASHILTVS